MLARKKYSEADRILAIYSKDYGRITLLAKGVRKPTSRKRGHIEVFNHIKFQATSGKSLGLITEAEIIDAYVEIRKKLKKVALAYYFMEVIGKTTREHEKNEELYDLLLKYLSLLREQSALKKLRAEFVYEVLTTLGFWPKGKRLLDIDGKLEEVTERKMNTERVGKRMLMG